MFTALCLLYIPNSTNTEDNACKYYLDKGKCNNLPENVFFCCILLKCIRGKQNYTSLPCLGRCMMQTTQKLSQVPCFTFSKNICDLPFI